MNAATTQILVGIVIATVSSWITVHMSLGRFRREKWWERKVAAYERIIDALHASKADAEAWLAASYEYKEFQKDQQQEIEKRARLAHMEIVKAIDVGEFVLCGAAHSRLVQYRKESREEEDNEDVSVHVQTYVAATDRCIADLIAIAKKDLQTLTLWHWVIRK